MKRLRRRWSPLRTSILLPPTHVRRWAWSFLVVPLVRADQDARAHLASSSAPDFKVVTLLVYTAAALTLQQYFCRSVQVESSLSVFRAVGLDLHYPFTPGTLPSLIWWTTGNFLLYFIFPALIVRLVFHEPLANYGVKLRGAFADGWVYLVMLSVVGPLVWLTSRDQHFQETYPFYRPPSGKLGVDFWVWEGCYALQFVGLEFFFRGLLVHGLKHRFGPYCIPVMTIPYCMIHFNKPLPETVASIVAGLALGFMSLRTRSIALGAILHILVAVSMDLASLWRQGFFTD